jgi:hypothetical protein
MVPKSKDAQVCDVLTDDWTDSFIDLCGCASADSCMSSSDIEAALQCTVSSEGRIVCKVINDNEDLDESDSIFH